MPPPARRSTGGIRRWNGRCSWGSASLSPRHWPTASFTATASCSGCCRLAFPNSNTDSNSDLAAVTGTRHHPAPQAEHTGSTTLAKSQWSFKSATELSRALAAKKVSAVELAQDVIGRIERHDDRINAV